MDFQTVQVLAMWQKGFLLQQAVLGALWLTLAAALAWLNLLNAWFAVLLLIGVLASLGLNRLLHWWLDSDLRRHLVLEGMLSSSSILIWTVDAEGVIGSFYGYTVIFGALNEGGAVGRKVHEYFADHSSFLADIERALRGESVTVSHEINGRYCRHHLRSQTSQSGRPNGVLCVSIDLTREPRLIRQVELAQKVFDHTHDAVAVADDRRRILMVNSAFCEITQFSSDEVVGLKLSFPPMENQGLRFYREIWRTLRAGHIWRGEVTARRKDEEAFAAKMTLVPITDRSGKVCNYLTFLAGATLRRESQDELRYLVNHDPLTGLPNRRLFLDRLNQAIRRARRSGRKLAIYFMDLDHFKAVNDNYGHQAGDVLLKEVADRLLDVVRESDTVARFAGDEFTLIAEDIDDDEQVVKIADKILESFHVPFQIDGHTVHSGASIGIAIYPEEGEDALALVKAADVAMYSAKEDGRGRYHLSSQHRYFDDLAERLTTRNDLGRALKQQQLSLVYQPIVSIDRGEVIGCEALLRWHHHRYGVLPASEFIAIAEEAGLMPQFGDWVLKTACTQLRVWHDQGYSLGILSVNLSHDQLSDTDFPARLLAILDEARFAPTSLILEIAEGVVLNHLKETSSLVETLSSEGIRFSIDDFGTGTSTYTYLKSLPVHLLKIDHRILNETRQTTGNEGFIRAVISLADLMGMQVMAEGIEREPQERFLREAGCNLGQGYLYGRPVDAESFALLLAANRASRQDGEPYLESYSIVH